MAIRRLIETAWDRMKLALAGCGRILRRPKYLCLFLASLLFILYLLTFFRDGSGNWQLLWSGLPFERKLEALGRVFLGIGDNFSSFYGISIILMSLLQALVIMLLVFAWRHREKNAALDNASTGGIAAILGFIALGCPSCGVGLLAPILSAIAGGAAMALAEGISCFFTIVAFLLLIFTVVRLGYIDFVIISSNNVKEKKNAKRS